MIFPELLRSLHESLSFLEFLSAAVAELGHRVTDLPGLKLIKDFVSCECFI